MSTFINATEFGIYIDSTLVSFSTNCSLEVSMDTREITNKESEGNAEFRESKKSWIGSGEFIFNSAAPMGYSALFDAWQDRDQVTVRFSTETSQAKYYDGKAYITSMPLSAPMEDNMTFTVSLQGTGKLAEKTKT